MWRNLCEISCGGHFPWTLKVENLRKIRQNFAAFFDCLLRLTGQELHPNFAVGGHGHETCTRKTRRKRDRSYFGNKS